MRVMVIGEFSLDERSAPSARACHLADALSKAGARVDLMPLGRRPADMTAVEERCKKDFGGGVYWINDLFQDAEYGVGTCAIHSVQKKIEFWRKLRDLRANQAGSQAVVFSNASFVNIAIALFSFRGTAIQTYVHLGEWFPAAYYRNSYLSLNFYNTVLVREKAVKWAHGVICISKYISDQLTSRGVQHALVVPAMVSPAKFARDIDHNNHDQTGLRAENRPFVMAYSGKGKEEDGFLLILDALNVLLAEKFNVCLKISGPFSRQTLSYYLDKLEFQARPVLSSKIAVEGWLSPDQYSEFIQSSDCLVLPRPDSQITRANFPTRLPEFLASGTPAIIGSAGDVGELLRNGDGVVLLKPEPSAEEIAAAVRAMIKDPEWKKKMAHRATEVAERVFSTKQHSERLYNFVNTESA